MKGSFFRYVIVVGIEVKVIIDVGFCCWDVRVVVNFDYFLGVFEFVVVIDCCCYSGFDMSVGIELILWRVLGFVECLGDGSGCDGCVGGKDCGEMYF